MWSRESRYSDSRSSKDAPERSHQGPSQRGPKFQRDKTCQNEFPDPSKCLGTLPRVPPSRRQRTTESALCRSLRASFSIGMPDARDNLSASTNLSAFHSLIHQ